MFRHSITDTEAENRFLLRVFVFIGVQSWFKGINPAEVRPLFFLKRRIAFLVPLFCGLALLGIQPVAAQVFSVSTSLFAVGSLTQVQIPIGSWDIDFGSTQITGWNIGGGGVGTMDFQMTFDNLAFTGVSAIPEPATNAALLGLAAIGLVVFRRRRW